MKTQIEKLMPLLDDIELDKSFEKNLLTFSDFFLETAKTLNLTAIKEPSDVIIKHYYDSLYPLKEGLIKKGDSVIDIGCGGGFPSMPLKLAFPECRFLLLDSLKKRLTFLDNAINLLDLSDISTLHSRAEEGARKENLRDSFDVAVSRAVASLDLLCELCLPYVKVGGIFIAYKSVGAPDEIENAKTAISKLSGSIEDIINYELPYGMGSRSLVIIKKIKPTHPSLPRSTKSMAKGPLK